MRGKIVLIYGDIVKDFSLFPYYLVSYKILRISRIKFLVQGDL